LSIISVKPSISVEIQLQADGTKRFLRRFSWTQDRRRLIALAQTAYCNDHTHSYQADDPDLS